MDGYKKHEKEFIICSAIWVQNGEKYDSQPKNVDNGYVVCGRRHHNCLRTISIFNPLEEWIEEKKNSKIVQGFLTNEDRFVDREEGAKVAFNSGQISKEDGILISEELWLL